MAVVDAAMCAIWLLTGCRRVANQELSARFPQRARVYRLG